MPLTDTAVRKAKLDKARAQKLYDARGLFLLVTPSGAKCWRFKYRFAGKEKLLALGTYPDVSLADARERRDDARKLVARDLDPGDVKKAQKAAEKEAGRNTFEAVAREWYIKHSPSWVEGHRTKIIARLERDVFPYIGRRAVSAVSAPEILALLRRIEARGALDTAHRAHQNVSAVLRYAVATGRAERDPAADLRGALPPAQEKHYPTISDPKGIGALMRAIVEYDGAPTTQCALRLAPLVFVRPGELRQAEWAEFDIRSAIWRIPAGKMKSRIEHLVPLSRQALKVLQDLKPFTGDGRYLFPSIRTRNRPMSGNTINGSLRRLGYGKSEMTGHGFRSMASTVLNEEGWNKDAIERQLAHAERDEVRGAYNKAEHLPERRKMMQSWADLLDKFAKPTSSVKPSRNKT